MRKILAILLGQDRPESSRRPQKVTFLGKKIHQLFFGKCLTLEVIWLIIESLVNNHDFANNRNIDNTFRVFFRFHF